MRSPVEFTFLLRNATLNPQSYRFEVDTYQIPELPFCDQRPPSRDDTSLDAGQTQVIPVQHERRNYPIPTGWAVSIEPSEPRLNPEEEQAIRVTVTPPDGFKGRQPVNVHAFHLDGLAGGVTVYVES